MALEPLSNGDRGMSTNDETYHTEWTLSPQHAAVLKDMRAAGNRRLVKERSEQAPAVSTNLPVRFALQQEEC